MPVGSDPTLPRPHCPMQGGPAAGTNAPGTSPSATTGMYYIKGTVTGNGGTPLANIEVDAYTSNYSYYGYVWTASDGTYSVAVPMTTGSYTVRFYDNSGTYLHGYYSSGGFTTSEGSATPVAVTTSDVTGISVQLRAGYHIKGKVTGSGGTPLANIQVGANSSDYGGSATTALDGTYSVHVAAGSYTVSFYDNSGTYLNGYYSSGGFTISQGSATPVAVTTSDVTDISVQLGTGHSIKGTVTGTGGTALSGVEVDVYSNDYYGWTLTGSDGTYSVDVPVGTYTVSFYDNSGTYLNGYYSSGGFVLDSALATAVSVGSSDVTGINVTLWPSGATYHALTPTRLLDTRNGTGGLGVFSSHVAQTFAVTGHGGVPSGATAVTGNLTVTGQSSLGYLSVGPVAQNNPTSSTLNFPLNDDRANAVTVALDGNGKLSITYAAPTSGPTAQVIFDVTGYFTPDWSGARYVALAPTRILDSRNGTGLSGAFSSHSARPFQVTGLASVPGFAIAVTGNLTVTQQTSLGYLYIGPQEKNNPTSSTLNFPMNDDRANAVTVALNTDGSLAVTYAAPTSGPTAHAIFDVTGYFVQGSGQG